MGGTWWMAIFVYTVGCAIMMMMIERSQPDAATRCLCSGEEGPACLSQERLCYLSLFLHFLLFIIVKFGVWKAFLRHLRKYRISNIYSPNKERFWVATLDRNDTRSRNIIGFPLPIGLWSLEDKKNKVHSESRMSHFSYIGSLSLVLWIRLCLCELLPLTSVWFCTPLTHGQGQGRGQVQWQDQHAESTKVHCPQSSIRLSTDYNSSTSWACLASPLHKKMRQHLGFFLQKVRCLT